MPFKEYVRLTSRLYEPGFDVALCGSCIDVISEPGDILPSLRFRVRFTGPDMRRLSDVFKATRFPMFVNLIYAVCMEYWFIGDIVCAVMFIISGGSRTVKVWLLEFVLISVRFIYAVYSPATSVKFPIDTL